MEVYRIDENRYYVEPAILSDGEGMSDDCVSVMPTQGLHRARWNSGEWIEGLTQEEIEELNNQPIELTEIEKLKISQAEQFETILMIIGGI